MTAPRDRGDGVLLDPLKVAVAPAPDYDPSPQWARVRLPHAGLRPEIADRGAYIVRHRHRPDATGGTPLTSVLRMRQDGPRAADLPDDVLGTVEALRRVAELAGVQDAPKAGPLWSPGKALRQEERTHAWQRWIRYMGAVPPGPVRDGLRKLVLEDEWPRELDPKWARLACARVRDVMAAYYRAVLAARKRAGHTNSVQKSEPGQPKPPADTTVVV